MIREQAEGGSIMSALHRALGLFVLSFLAAVMGGMNLVMTADDSPLVAATRLHPITTMAWNVLAVAAVLCGVTVILIAITLYRSILIYAWKERRVEIFAWLATPFFGMGTLMLWVAACMTFAHGRWAPSPWAILGDGGAPSFWPPLKTRWICGIISVVLISAVGLASACSVREAIRFTDFGSANEKKRPRRRRSAVSAGLLVTGCTLAMFFSVLIWGVSLARNFPNLVHQKLGLLNGPATVSWIVSLFLFGLASAICIRASRSILNIGIEVPE